jgi:hypothetical protein
VGEHALNNRKLQKVFYQEVVADLGAKLAGGRALEEPRADLLRLAGFGVEEGTGMAGRAGARLEELAGDEAEGPAARRSCSYSARLGRETNAFLVLVLSSARWMLGSSEAFLPPALLDMRARWLFWNNDARARVTSSSGTWLLPA